MYNSNTKSLKVKNGNEKIIVKRKGLNHKLIDFWRWSSSDLLSNTTRGKFAEFIVSIAMNINLSYVRKEWGKYDLEASVDYDLIRIEVKSSAYLQTWDQFKDSKIIFSIKKTGKTSIKSENNHFIRPSDVYVFCLLKHKNKNTVNPLNMNQWSFYVMSTKKVDEIFHNRSSISLSILEKHTTNINFSDLQDEIVKKYKEK